MQIRKIKKMEKWLDKCIGLKYERLTITGHYMQANEKGQNYTMVICQCECGNIKDLRASYLKNKIVKSCGCVRGVSRKNVPKSHGETIGGVTKEYNAWSGMKSRCYNKDSHNYRWYGGLGVKVCQRWFDSYEDFLTDMGRAPSRNMTLDRIDPEGDYRPDNVRWATWEVQRQNKRKVI